MTTEQVLPTPIIERQGLIAHPSEAIRFPCQLLFRTIAILSLLSWGGLCLWTQLSHIEVSSIMLLIITLSMVTFLVATALAFCCPVEVMCCQQPAIAVASTPNYQAINARESPAPSPVIASHQSLAITVVTVFDQSSATSVGGASYGDLSAEAPKTLQFRECKGLPPAAPNHANDTTGYISFDPQGYRDEHPSPTERKAGPSDVTRVAFEV